MIFGRISRIIHQRRWVSYTMTHVGKRVSRMPRTVRTCTVGVCISWTIGFLEAYLDIVVIYWVTIIAFGGG